MFSITGSTMKHATSPFGSTRSSASGSLYGMTITSSTMRLRDAAPSCGTEFGRVGRTGLVERRLVGDHHLVVVAVVAALDLDDLAPAR